MSTTSNTSSLKAEVYFVIEQLALTAPLTVKGFSVHNGLMRDINNAISQHLSAEKDCNTNPEYALEMYALKKLAVASERMFRHYSDDNFIEAAKSLQECFQSALLLKSAPDTQYVTFNTFLTTMLVAVASQSHFTTIVGGTVFTRHAVLAMMSEAQLYARLDYELLFTDIALSSFETRLEHIAQRVMKRFASEPNAKSVHSSFPDEISVENPKAEHRFQFAINATRFLAVVVDYGDSMGYFGVEGKNLLKQVIEETMEKLIQL